MTLEDLGKRICVMGPSNSGKSTLASAIGRARGLQTIHLDQLHYEPETDWEPRGEEEFRALHDDAILGERWVMDGNYSRLLAQRLDRATGIILLDVSTSTSLLRYVRRSWFERDRAGALQGARDSVKLGMIRHIAVTTRANRRSYRKMVSQLELPRVRLSNAREIDSFYRSEGLLR